MILPSNLQTVIFDLGGVIIDLDESRTVRAFEALSSLSPNEIQQHYASHPAFVQFETNALDDASFRNEIRNLLRHNVDDATIDKAWNAMLVGLPIERLNLLKRLKEHYQVFILSNTNGIHITHVNEVMLPEIGYKGVLDDFVHAAYYSHRIGKRKPDDEIFRHVIKENNLNPSRTLFLDDKPANLAGAENNGIHGLLIRHPDMIFDIFN